MSWNIRYESADAFAKDERASSSTFGDVGEHVQDQIDTARAVASKLIDSGSVGAPDKDYSVSLSGHANPKHEPKAGWANDTITITVTQK